MGKSIHLLKLKIFVLMVLPGAAYATSYIPTEASYKIRAMNCQNLHLKESNFYNTEYPEKVATL